MSETTAVPVIVLSRHEDNAEAINRVLRNGGRAARVTRLDDAGDLARQLSAGPSELVVAFADESPGLLGTAADLLAATDTELPLVSCREQLDEDTLAEDIAAGAQDTVTLRRLDRLGAVLERTLRTGRLNRALREAVHNASSYREQFQQVIAGTADAIAHVGEGIVLNANHAWARLFGFEDAQALAGLTFMDLFSREHQSAIKGALVACSQGRWAAQGRLKALGINRQDQPIALLLELEPAFLDKEPCVRVRVPARSQQEDEESLAERLRAALRLDPVTGLYSRRHFLERLAERLDNDPPAGVQGLVLFRIDHFERLHRQIGVSHFELVLAELGDILRNSAQARDLYGLMGTGELAVLAARGTRRDLKAWAQSVISRVTRSLFEAGGKSVSLSLSAGVAMVSRRGMPVDELYAEASEALSRAAEFTGGQVGMSREAEDSSRIEEEDRLWVSRIKRALGDNRFRLADQPIASLAGEDRNLHDLFVRMIDEQGDEVMPSQFMSAATRHRLVQNIDRWVINAAFQYCQAHPGAIALVRLSRETLVDRMLPAWLETCRKNTQLPEGVLVFQVSEDVVASHLKQTLELVQKLQQIGFGFSLEGFTAGPTSQQILTHLPIDYLKIDGSLMQGLAGDERLQERVRSIVQQARERSVRTIAERVEDANTLAVLWQLGVHYVQGYQVSEPEVVLSGG